MTYIQGLSYPALPGYLMEEGRLEYGALSKQSKLSVEAI